MPINKSGNGGNNICDKKATECRENMGLSQRWLADNLQLRLDIDKNAIQRNEAEKRYVTDIEIICLSKALKTTMNIHLGLQV